MVYDLLSLTKMDGASHSNNKIFIYDFQSVLNGTSQIAKFSTNEMKELLDNKGVRYESENGYDIICVWRNLCIDEINHDLLYLILNKQDLYMIGDVVFLEHFMNTLKNVDVIRRNSIGKFLHFLLLYIIKDYQLILEHVSQEIDELESRVMSEKNETNHSQDILYYRKKLLLRERRYEQTADVLDYLLDDSNGLYDDVEKNHFTILKDRIDRMCSHVVSLLEYVTEIREAYQSALDVRQNKLMTLFTIISTIFLPLTLLVGWYGMNFNMPEFEMDYAYPIIIVASVLIIVFCIIYFKKKKWF